MFHVKPFLLTLCLLAALAGFAQTQFSTVALQDRTIPAPLAIDQEVMEWNHAQPAYAALGEKAQEFLYWTNYSRKDPRRFWDSVVAPVLKVYPQLWKGTYAISLKMDLYKSGPLKMLRLNDTLIQTAQAHASDIGLKNAAFSHSSTDGRSFQVRFKQAGLKNFGAENISSGAGNMMLSLVMLYLDYGLDHPGHRITLLNSDYTDIGIGISPYGESIFGVQHFCSPQPQLSYVSRGTEQSAKGKPKP